MLVPEAVCGATLDLDNGAVTRANLDQTPGVAYDTVTNGRLTLSINAPRSLDFAGSLRDGANPLSLQINGGGTLTLSGSGLNTYSGTTRMSGNNLLRAGATNVLSPNSTINNGTVDLAGYDQVVRGLVGSGRVVNSASTRATLTLATPAGPTVSFTGSIAGDVAILKTGAGRHELTTASSYTGGTTVAAGILAYGNSAAFGTGTVTLAGGSLVARGTDITIANAIELSSDALINLSAFDTTLAGPIGGAAPLTFQSNSGTLTLTGTNTYTGGTTLIGGTTLVGSNTAFGAAASRVTVTANATLGLADEAAGTAFRLANDFTLATFMRLVVPNAGTTLTLDGTIDGTSGLWLRTGDGVVRLGGDNSYTGLTQLSSGTLAVTSSTALGASLLRATAPARLRIDAAGLTIGNGFSLTPGQVLTIDTNGFDVELSGAFRNQTSASGGGFVKTGAGTLTLSAVNSYSGGTRLVAGGIAVADDRGLGRASSPLVFAGTGPRGGELIVTGTAFGTTGRAIVLEGTGGTFNIADVGNRFVLGQEISGSGELGKSGPGTLALNAANNYSGGTYLAGGTLGVGHAGALGSGTLTIAGGTLLADVAGLTLTNDIVLSGAGTIDSGADGLMLDGRITGASRLTKAGAGTLVLANAGNGYNGGTALAAGTIAIGTAAAIGSGDVVMADGTTLSTTASLTLTNRLALTGLATVATGANATTIAGSISGNGRLAKSGSGTLTLAAASSFAGGVQADGGTIVVLDNASLGSGSAAFGPGTTLRAGANALALANVITVAGSSIDTQGFGLTLDGGIGGTSFLKNGSGTLILNAANEHSGGTSVVEGTIGVGNSRALGTGVLDLATGTTLRATADRLVLANALTVGGSTIDTQGFDLTIDGDVDGVMLRKTGAGALMLNGTSHFANEPVVDGGMLMVNGAIVSNAIRINAGATLGGTGTAYGMATIAGGARLSPGRSPGTLTLGGLALADASDVLFDLATPDVVGGTTNDLVQVIGDLTLDGRLTVADNPGFGPGVYALFRYGGALTDNGLAIASLPNAVRAQVQALIPGQVNLIVTGAGALVQYWDGGDAIGNGRADGGVGSWTAGGTNWTGAAPSEINSNWQGGVGVFVAPGGAVSIVGSQAFAGLQFVGDGYALGGGGLVAAPAAFVSVDAGATTTIAAPITGGSLDKQGGGRLILSGANGYTGGTTVTAGTLGVGAATALGTGALTLGAGTTLQAAAGITLGNAVTLGGSATVDTQGFALALGGVVGGTGGLTKTGSGTLTLGGSNAFAGGTTVAAGTIVAGTSTAFGAGGIALSGGTTLRSGGAGLVLGNTMTLNGAATIDTASFGLVIGGVVGGTGSLTKTGAGVLRLDGANSYAGGTTVMAGTLAVGGDRVLGSGALALAANTTLQAAATMTLANAVTLGGPATVDTQAFAMTLGGVVGGPGALTKTGAGVLTLTGANGYSGGTTIAAGTLVAGGPAALGTGALALGAGTTLRGGVTGLVLANAVALTGAATVDTATAMTLGGVVSGSGALTKTGAGSLTLAAANSYSGGTTIAGGTLSGSATSFGTGAIANAGALVIAQATDASFASAISGTGTLTKTGAGNLTLAAANPLSGATTVAAGRLTVTGSLSPSIVTVASGASLAGTGTIGGLVAQSGSLVAPGTVAGTIGTLTVAGTVAFAAGSTFAVDVSPTTADRLTVGGTATLAGALTIAPTGGQYLFNSAFTLVSAGSLTGTFTPPVLTGLFGPAFTPVLAYSGTALTLTLRPASLITLAAGLTLTPNQRAVAAAFDRATSAGFNPQGFFALYNQGAAFPAALEQLTGEVHSASSRVAIEDTRHVREAALDRLGAALSGLGRSPESAATRTIGERSTTLWGRAVGSWGRTDATAIASGFDHDVKGTILGFDIAKGGVKAGALVHYTRSDVDYARPGHANVESTGIGVYAGYRADGGLAVGIGGSIASIDIDTSRAITTVGYAQALRSESGGEAHQAFADVAFDFAAGAGARIEPFVRAAYTWVRADALRETGGIAALSRPNQTYDATFATLGLRGAIAAGDAVSLRGSAGWRRTSGDRSPAASLAIAGTGSAASIAGVALDRNAFAGEAGVDVRFGPRATLGVGYSGVIGRDNRDHGGRATLTIGF